MTAGSRREDELAAARGRHPTARWTPDLDRMRRRLEGREGDRRAVAVTAEAYREGDARA